MMSPINAARDDARGAIPTASKMPITIEKAIEE
jgi:hypothetical protein